MDDDTRPTKYDNKGPTYRPVTRPQPKTVKKPPTTNRPTSSAPPPPRKKKPGPNKPNFAIFYVVALFIAVVICLMLFAYVFSSVNNNDEDEAITTTEKPAVNASTENPAIVNESKEIVGIILDIDKDNLQMEIVDVNTRDDYFLKADNSTEIKNKSNQNIIFAELNKGDVINGKFDTNTKLLSSISQNPDAWEKNLADDVIVDEGLKAISVDGKNYFYNDDTLVLYNEQAVPIEEIEPIDVVTLKGYKDEVWYIDVVKGHGKLSIPNSETLENGTIEIDTSVSKELADAEPIFLTEGPHKIVINGDNIEPFTQEVEITTGSVTAIDLANVQYKTSVLTIKTNVDSPTIVVDSETYPANEPIIIDLGEYVVEVSKEGYLPWSDTVMIDDPETQLTVELEKSIPMCSITVASNIVGAEVYIDNGYIGLTPVTELVPYGTHTVVLKQDGYEDYIYQWEAAKEIDSFSANMKEITKAPPKTNPPSTGEKPIVTPGKEEATGTFDNPQ